MLDHFKSIVRSKVKNMCLQLNASNFKLTGNETRMHSEPCPQLHGPVINNLWNKFCGTGGLGMWNSDTQSWCNHIVPIPLGSDYIFSVNSAEIFLKALLSFFHWSVRDNQSIIIDIYFPLLSFHIRAIQRNHRSWCTGSLQTNSTIVKLCRFLVNLVDLVNPVFENVVITPLDPNFSLKLANAFDITYCCYNINFHST